MKALLITISFFILFMALAACSSSDNARPSRTLWNHLNGSDAFVYEHSPDQLSTIVLNADPITEFVRFNDPAWSFSIDIPYNPNWGTIEKYVNPFDIYNERIVFGPVVQCSPYGAPCRLNSLQRKDPVSLAQIKADLQRRMAECTTIYCDIQNLEEIETDNVVALMYDSEGIMLSTNVVLVTRDGQHYSMDALMDRNSIKQMIQSISNK